MIKRSLFFSKTNTLKQALKQINVTGEKCLIIIDDDNRLLGTLSDGDLRRAILRGIDISNTIDDIYQKNPTVLVKGDYKLEEVRKLFLKNKFDLIPIVDKEGKVIDVIVWDRLFKNGEKKQRKILEVPLIVMAGGKGSRLEPFTKVLPKPLVPLNGKPIIEHIINSFINVGINRVILTINYKARIMKAFFEELNPKYMVEFVEEQKPLGTAGSLKLLEGKLDIPFFVTNCDIIIKTDYLDLYEFHLKNSFDITLVASAKKYIIPYGTCELNGDGHLKRINEKPEYNFLVNTGLYILNPDVLQLIPKSKFYNITQLIENAMGQGKQVGVYPVDDDTWIDIGQWSEYHKAVEGF